jgi:hypothetical protein
MAGAALHVALVLPELDELDEELDEELAALFALPASFVGSSCSPPPEEEDAEGALTGAMQAARPALARRTNAKMARRSNDM